MFRGMCVSVCQLDRPTTMSHIAVRIAIPAERALSSYFHYLLLLLHCITTTMMSDEVLVWLSVWSEVQIAYGPADATASRNP